jgi:cupin 2 domain-containing protein
MIHGEEQFQKLLETPTVRIERIVSEAHQSPPGFWYDQSETEWVMVLRGAATLELHGGEFVELKAGDYVTIPCHKRHRVHRTTPGTIWLAVHVSEPFE